MSRAVTFTEADVKRAVKAAEAAGKTVGALRIDPRTGEIVLTFDQPKEQPAASPLEEWRRKRGQSAA